MLPELQAEQQLLTLEAVSVPNMKQESRTAVFQRYMRRLRSAPAQPKSAIEALTQAGIQIVREPKRAKPAAKRRDTTGRDKGVKHER